MMKFVSQLVGAKVLLYQEGAIVGEASRVLIDPDDATFVGLAVQPSHLRSERYIPTSEIKGYGSGYLMAKGLSSLSEENEVIKIRKVLSNEPQIIGARVVTEDGTRIGKVADATVNLKDSILDKLYLTSLLNIGLLGEQKIIDRSQILKIEKKKIIVRDTKETKPVPANIAAEATLTEKP